MRLLLDKNFLGDFLTCGINPIAIPYLSRPTEYIGFAQVLIYHSVVSWTTSSWL